MSDALISGGPGKAARQTFVIDQLFYEGVSMVKVKATRRGGILIEPYKQLRFGVMFLVINLIFSSLVFAVFGYFLWDIYGTLSVYFKLDEAQSVITLAKLGKPAGIGLALIAMFIGATLAMSARYTHQIYGPMVSIRRFLDELIEGKKPAPIKLRSSDQLQELAERLNGVSQKFLKGRPSGDSAAKVAEHLEKMLEGKADKQLELSKDDPLHEIAQKLNQLSRKITS